jgi:hypothetical protein
MMYSDVLIDKEDCALRSLLRPKEEDGDVDRSSESEGEDIEEVERKDIEKVEGRDIEEVEGEEVEEVEGKGKGKQVAGPSEYSLRCEANIKTIPVMFKEMTAHKIPEELKPKRVSKKEASKKGRKGEQAVDKRVLL